MSVRFDTNSSDVLYSTTNLASPILRTVCYWVKFISTGAGSLRDLSVLYDGGPTNVQKIDWTNANALQLYANTNAIFASNPTITNWTFFAVTATTAGAGSVIGYFRDNAATSLTSQSVTGVNFTPTTMTIGQIGSASCSAEIAYFMEFDNVFTPAQVLLQSKQATPLGGFALRRYLAMTKAATAGSDTSANGYNLTVSGTLTDGASVPVFNPANPSRRMQRIYETIYSFE